MKFDFISDLHMSHYRRLNQGEYPWEKGKKSDILVLAGDMSGGVEESITVIDTAQKVYDTVLFTDGNHEHYNSVSVDANKASLSKFVLDTSIPIFHSDNAYVAGKPEIEDSIVYLNGKETHYKDETLFIGANAWYDFRGNVFLSRFQQIKAWEKGMNDARLIDFDGVPPEDRARQEIDLLKDHVRKAQNNDHIKEIVVVTHTVPIKKALIPDDNANPPGDLNGSFFNSMAHEVWNLDKKKKIAFWGFGHTHFRYDGVHHGIRFVNNAQGYPSENKSDGFGEIMQIDTEEELDINPWKNLGGAA